MTLRSEGAQRFILGLVGVGLFLAIWQVIGAYRLAGMTWPKLTDVLAFIADPSKQALFVRAMLSSFGSVAIGYVLGIVLGVGVAILGRVLPVS
jgi:NitT/TauT family transport system permease protein